jgi:ferritin-like metal-binding protein YciE
MGIFTADTKSIRDLYRDMLERAHSSEKQLVTDGLPAMIKQCTNAELHEAFQKHLDETRMHVTRLERILDAVEGEENSTRCKVTAALISATDSAAGDAQDAQLRDVILIAMGNQVEHVEIATYGTLKALATMLGETEQAASLDKTLQEEKAADDVLTKLAAQINVQAPVEAKDPAA